MNYFKRHIGDYHKKAGRLTMLQHGAYTLLIDACYDREKFPTLEEAIDWAWASTDEEVQAVTFVLKKFFVELEDGTFIQHRIQDEIDDYRARCDKNAEIAKAREEKKRKAREEREARMGKKSHNVEDEARNVQDDHDTCTNESRSSTNEHLTINHKPETINHKPETINHKQDTADEALAVIEYWNSKRPAKCRVKTKTWKPKAKARLQTFDYSDIIEAMDYILTNPWHIQNDEVSIKNAISSDERLSYVLEKTRSLQLKLENRNVANENSKPNTWNQTNTPATATADTRTTSGYSQQLDAEAEAYYAQHGYSTD